jgi:hypothetical protein
VQREAVRPAFVGLIVISPLETEAILASCQAEIKPAFEVIRAMKKS